MTLTHFTTQTLVSVALAIALSACSDGSGLPDGPLEFPEDPLILQDAGQDQGDDGEIDDDGDEDRPKIPAGRAGTFGQCNTEGATIAITNGVATTISAPKNSGECDLKLYCADKKGKQVGLHGPLKKGANLVSYSCNTNAVSIRMDCLCDEKDKTCLLTWTP